MGLFKLQYYKTDYSKLGEVDDYKKLVLEECKRQNAKKHFFHPDLFCTVLPARLLFLHDKNRFYHDQPPPNIYIAAIKVVKTEIEIHRGHVSKRHHILNIFSDQWGSWLPSFVCGLVDCPNEDLQKWRAVINMEEEDFEYVIYNAS